MFNTLDLLQQALVPQSALGASAGWYGVFPALVTDVRDPDGQGRVKITLPWAADSGNGRYEAWARLATLMGGKQRGSWFVPDVQDEVLVAFEGGNPRRPYVLGGLWNGSDAPPESMDGAGRNTRKVLCSRNGVKITFDDEDGHEQLLLETPGGQKVTLMDGPSALLLEDGNGNSVKLESAGITITAASKLSISAGTVEISAGKVSVTAGLSDFSGVVKSPTAIINSVVGTSYTPGAGNIW